MCKPQADSMHTRCADRKHSKLCRYGRAFLYMQAEENMNKLQERAFSFKKLIDYEYKIVLGRKGKKTELVINFEKTDFPHLIGLHKLTDVLNGNIATEKTI